MHPFNRRFFASILLSFSVLFLTGQKDPKIITSPVFKHKKPRVYLEKMLGEINGVYYVMYSTEPVKISTLPSLYIKMYKSSDMSFIQSKPLINVDNKALVKSYKDYVLNDYLLTKNGLQFFFLTKGRKGIRDVYLGRYDLNLNQERRFEKVLTYDSDERRFVGLANDEYPNTILTTLNYNGGSEKLFVEYRELDDGFNLVRKGRVYLPKQPSANSGRIFNKKEQAYARSLSLSDEGKIITSINVKAETEIKTTNSGRNKKDRFADDSYMSVLVIDPMTEAILEVPIKLKGSKNVDNFSWYADGKKIFVTGFYSNREKERKGNELHGVFYKRVDVKSGKTELSKSTVFPDAFLYKVNSQNTLLNRRKRKKETKRESINESFQISEVIVDLETKEITAYCEPIENYITQSSDQNGMTYNTYHSVRGSLFYFKVEEDGSFDFFNTIRKKTHWSSGSPAVWDRKSVFLYRNEKGDKDFILYSTQRIFSEQDPTDTRGKKAKWRKSKRDFVIAAINTKTGRYDLNYPQEYSKRDRKNLGILVDNISESNDHLYSYGIKRKMRASRIITAAILAVPTFFIVPYVIYFSQKSYYQKVQLNRMDL